jgi:acetyl esterase/lipase
MLVRIAMVVRIVLLYLRELLHRLILFLHDHLDAWVLFEGSGCYDGIELCPATAYGDSPEEYFKKMRPTGASDLNHQIPICYVHGGGWVSCAAEMSCMFAAQVARERPVYSANYPLSPNAKFPDAAVSLLKMLRFLRAASGLTQVILVGDSSGASIASMVCAYLCNKELRTYMDSRYGLTAHEGESYPSICLFVGISGIFDRAICSASGSSFADRVFLRGLLFCFQCYDDAVEPGSMPLDHVVWSKVRSFPEALLISSEFDPVSPSSEAFAAKLKALASAPSELIVYPQVPHGFANLPRAFRTAHMNEQYLQAWARIRSFAGQRAPTIRGDR